MLKKIDRSKANQKALLSNQSGLCDLSGKIQRALSR